MSDIFFFSSYRSFLFFLIIEHKHWKTGGIRCTLKWSVQNLLHINNTLVPGGVKMSELESVKFYVFPPSLWRSLRSSPVPVLVSMVTKRGVENPEATMWSLALSHVPPATTTYLFSKARRCAKTQFLDNVNKREQVVLIYQLRISPSVIFVFKTSKRSHIKL